jgi:hypothetical protein
VPQHKKCLRLKRSQKTIEEFLHFATEILFLACAAQNKPRIFSFLDSVKGIKRNALEHLVGG